MIIIQDTSYILPGKRCALAEVGNSRPIPPAVIAFRDHWEAVAAGGARYDYSFSVFSLNILINQL